MKNKKEDDMESDVEIEIEKTPEINFSVDTLEGVGAITKNKLEAF